MNSQGRFSRGFRVLSVYEFRTGVAAVAFFRPFGTPTIQKALVFKAPDP